MLMTSKFILLGQIHISNCLTGISIWTFKRLSKHSKSNIQLLTFPQHTVPFPIFLGSVNGTTTHQVIWASFSIRSHIHFIRKSISSISKYMEYIFKSPSSSFLCIYLSPSHNHHLTLCLQWRSSLFMLLLPFIPVSTTATTDLPSVNIRSCHPSA